MFFKKKRDKVRRCPNGHILDPSWDHCPYCEEGLEYTGEYSVSGNEEAPPPQPPPPAAPRPAAPPPAVPPPPPAVPSPPPAAPTPPSSPSGSEDYEDLTVVQMPPAAPPAAQPQAPGARGSEEPTVDTPPGGSRPVSPAPPPASPPPAAPPPAAPSEPARTRHAPAGQEGLVAWLIMTSGARQGQDWRLPARAVRIGKAPDCEIALPEEGYLSAHHAELAFDGTRFVVRDLGSTNGTSVNDRRVETSALEDGDRIVLGLTQFVFKCLRF